MVFEGMVTEKTDRALRLLAEIVKRLDRIECRQDIANTRQGLVDRDIAALERAATALEIRLERLLPESKPDGRPAPLTGPADLERKSMTHDERVARGRAVLDRINKLPTREERERARSLLTSQELDDGMAAQFQNHADWCAKVDRRLAEIERRLGIEASEGQLDS